MLQRWFFVQAIPRSHVHAYSQLDFINVYTGLKSLSLGFVYIENEGLNTTREKAENTRMSETDVERTRHPRKKNSTQSTGKNDEYYDRFMQCEMILRFFYAKENVYKIFILFHP